MRKSIKSLMLAAISMFAGVVAYAQVTTSTLSGKVADQNGAAVPGAAVVAVHVPSGTIYGATTNSDGRYSIQGMRTGGPYKVEFSCLGYQSVEYTDVTLQLGEIYNINAKINESSEFLQEVVVVASPTSKFASQEKTGATTNISNDDILALPSTSRSISDVAKLSPYGGNGMSFGGGDGRSTNFTIDGANFNNNFGLSANLPGGGMPVSLDAIEEVQVVVSPYDVRQSNFIGGGVNAITKSGTNTFKGTAYVYYQNANWGRGKHIAGGQDVVGDYSDKTVYGATIGGPIIKNKLFFFLSGEYSGNVREISYATWRPSDDGVANKDKGISRTTKADMDKVAKYLKDNYGYDTGGYTNYYRPFSNMKLLGRIDWNINQDHHLALRYNYTKNQSWTGTNGNSADFGSRTDDGKSKLDGTRLSLNRISEHSMAFVNSCYSTENNVWSVSLDLNSRLGANLSNQFLVTYSNIEDVRGSDSDKFPFIDIMAGYEVTDKGVKQTLEPYISAGYELFTWYNGVHNRVLNAKDDVTWYAGAHKVTAGASYEYQFADNSYIREGTGYYRFRSLDDFLNGEAPETVALSYGYGGNETPSARIQFSQIGLYAQDEWNVTDNFKLTAGIRFDTILYDENDIMTNNAIKALDYNGKHIDTGLWPKTNVQISPRVGFTWDIFGDKSLKLRGGTGLFAGRLPLVYMTNMPTNAAMFMNAKQAITTHYTNGIADDRNSGLDAFAAKNNGGKLLTDTADILNKLNELYPDRFPKDIKPEDGQLSGTINAVDRNFKMPQVWKSSLALDIQLPTSFPWTMTAEGIFNKTVNGTLIVDWNMKDNASWSQYAGSDNRHIYPSTSAGNGYYTNTSALVLTNTNKGYGYLVNFTTNLEPVKNLKLMFSYTHTEQKELTGMPGNDAGSVFQGLPTVEGPNFTVLQNSRYVQPDRLIASVTYKLPTRTAFSLFYEGIVPTGESYIYKGDVNGDSVQQDLIYIPKDANDVLFIDDANKNNFMAFVNQDKYLSANKGKYAEAYSVYAPMVHRFDFRLTQDFRIRIGKSYNTLQLNADLMNMTNLFNDKWGVFSVFDAPKDGQLLSLDHVDAAGHPVYKSNVGEGAKTWKLSTSAGQTWYLQLGLKYMFN